MIKHIYVFFIGILLATFVGVGIAAFYQGPKSPEYPIEEQMATEAKAYPTKSQVQFEKDQRDYMVINRIYSRNVSIIALIFSVIFLIISLTLFSKLQLISDGLLLGGLFTQLYSIARGFESEDSKFRFIAVSVGLITSLIVGYLKFIKPSTHK